MLLEKDLLKIKEKAKKAAEMIERLKVAADGLDAIDPVECCIEKPESGSPEAIEELVEIDESLGGEMED